ncbi:MAG: DUF4003 family protein [Clostridia bacterium]|nr:DUF4003 family protein [Clostridia bacterium]
MKPELEKLCSEYIANRDAVKKAFRWDNSALYAVCANIFCANGQRADADSLKECRTVIKKNTGAFSRFRSKKIRSILAGLLALGETPEKRMAQANDYYRLLRRHFKGTEYLVLAAFLLTDLADQNLTEETAVRGRELYRQMNRKHRMLTDKTDSVFAMLLAFSEKTDEELLEEVEACYRVLKTKFSGGAAQTAAQILSMSGGTAEGKVQRVTELYDALREAGVKYGHSSELSPLAALSLSDAPVSALVEEIREADEFLGEQKIYGKKDEDLAQRAMHAVMIVSDQYAGTSQVNITVMTNTLDMLIAQQQAKRITFALHALEFGAKFLDKSDKTSGEKAEKTDDGNERPVNAETAEKAGQ